MGVEHEVLAGFQEGGRASLLASRPVEHALLWGGPWLRVSLVDESARRRVLESAPGVRVERVLDCVATCHMVVHAHLLQFLGWCAGDGEVTPALAAALRALFREPAATLVPLEAQQAVVRPQKAGDGAPACTYVLQAGVDVPLTTHFGLAKKKGEARAADRFVALVARGTGLACGFCLEWDAAGQ